jgi:hypothetical protein
MRKPNACRVVATFFFLFVIAGNASADDDKDESEQEAEKKGGKFLAVPIVITEPAIGEGLGVGLVYFHAKKPEVPPKILTGKEVQRTGRRSNAPPTASGLFAAYTNNDTAGVGFGHSSSWADDKYRFVGAIAELKVNSTVFAADIPFNFTIEGGLAFASIKRRFGDTNLFIGGSISTLNADVGFNLGGNVIPPVDLFDFDFQTTGLALSGIYDARDDTMMPSSGQLVDLTGWWYDDAIGSDFNYTSLRLKVHSFHQLHKKFVLGLRLDATTVSGSPPFFAVPFVSLRGIPALRFQGDTAGVIEIEGRYNFASRWAGIAFAGRGFTDKSEPVFDTKNLIRAWGVGLRYKALEAQNVWVGLDLARGPEEDAWYIQVGHPW